MEQEIFDTIIIGAGPAGLSAAIYASRKALKTLVLTKDIGGQAALSGDIENYLGFTMITGAELAKKFREELQAFAGEGLILKEGVQVTGYRGVEDNFTVHTTEGDFKGKTIIIATGRTPKMLGIPGERGFLGKGVAVCATCDAPLYKGKDVAVIGGGNSALDAASTLMKLCRFVTIINNTDSLRGDQIMLQNVIHAPNVKIYSNSTVLEITGEQAVTGVKIKDGLTGQDQRINVSGVFVEIGWKPSTEFDQLTKKNQKGEIIVDEFCKSSVEGVWAVGDSNSLWGEQIIISAGEGAKAALMVAEHIAKIPHQATSNLHEG